MLKEWIKSIKIKSILFRSALFFWLAIFITLGVFLCIYVPYEMKSARAQMRSEAMGVASSIGQVTDNAIVLKDFSFVVEHCMEVLKENPDIKYLFVIKKDGFSLMHTPEGWQTQDLMLDSSTVQNFQSNSKIVYSDFVEEKVFHHTYSLNVSNIHWGWIHVGLSLEDYYHRIHAILFRIILSVVVCVLIGIFVSLFFAKTFIRPIVYLNRMLHKVTEGDLNVRVDLNTGDELESLAHSFNLMTESLRKFKEELEERVRKRTTQLMDANQALHVEIEEREKIENKQDELLKELENVNQELSDFAYVVSHDLKAPLRGIGSLAEWLVTDYRDQLDEEGKFNLQLLIGRVTRMHDLIDGILQYSRVGRIREERIPVDLNDLIEEVKALIGPPKNINITITDRLPTILFEYTRIEQVFQNIIGNAVKYMDKPEGLIEIAYTDCNSHLEFSVRDNGPGIDEKYYKKIFQIFQTLTPRDEYESTGIGLTLVKKIIDTNGGKIWVESQLGVGTAFHFQLPVELLVEDKELSIV